MEFKEHKKKSAKLSKAKLKKLMHEQFGVAEVNMFMVVDALTQAVMMKYSNEILAGKRSNEVNVGELQEEVARKTIAILGGVMQNYFVGGENGRQETTDDAEASAGVDEEASKASS